MSQVGFHLQTRQRRLGQLLGKELVGVAAAFLGTVHGHIGILHQRLGVTAILRINTDADAGADEKLLSDGDWCILQDIEDLFGNMRDGDRCANVLDDNQELITAQAANRIGFPHQFAQAPRHLAENAVTDLVAKGVVDVLEAIEIDKKDGQSCLITVRTLNGFVQSVAKQQAVGQTGQGVVVSLVIQLIVRVPQFGDVREDADVMRHVTPAVLDGADRQRLQKGLAILPPVPEFTLPPPAIAKSPPHLDIHTSILTPGLQDSGFRPMTSSSL
jgi:hypothetical protein